MKKQTTIIVSLLILFIIILGGYWISLANNKSENPQKVNPVDEDILDNQNDNYTIEWKQYDMDKYSFRYPKDWIINERLATRLFHENGPIGDSISVGFFNDESSQFWVHIYRIDCALPTAMDCLLSFHEGDQMIINSTSTVSINGINFYKIENSLGIHVEYTLLRDNIYYELGYFNSDKEILNSVADTVLSSFIFK